MTIYPSPVILLRNETTSEERAFLLMPIVHASELLLNLFDGSQI